jgi:hypothetical protein
VTREMRGYVRKTAAIKKKRIAKTTPNDLTTIRRKKDFQLKEDIHNPTLRMGNESGFIL